MELNDACDFLMRHTDYTREIAIDKLVQYDMNTNIIIREWMGIPAPKQIDSNRSNNQKVFDEFRTFLDDAAIKYYKKEDQKSNVGK